ncbi:hypothetical protein GKZ68_18565 [Hymenobacter sp. BRD128]|uniref:hypothetical protein n=1 Tax=Hymenobacter sp. BRD128 TaxID=2675878 RepID=UPI0015647591|nr:hypothetical protein [Hymenobacter sp. BRD128]QKG58457.1 hypothetical protein GKZ68_18565 [Hymenobacter sp. BRD128]
MKTLIKLLNNRLNGRLVLGIALGAVALASCKKTEDVTVQTPVKAPSNPITGTTLAGSVKGTLLSSVGTYTINSDLKIGPKDTLFVQKGVTVNVPNNSTVYVQGVIDFEGTQASPITFTSPKNANGSWGGFQCDSAQAVTIKWTHIDYTGGPDATGRPRATLVISPKRTLAKRVPVIIEDSWFKGGLDDAIFLSGMAQVSVQRNTIEHEGSTDGESINIYDGVTGTIAYNVIWADAGSGIKIDTDAKLLTPQTVVTVNNNTLVANGYRRGYAEPGRGILVDRFAAGQFYNNLLVNNYYGLDINAAADTKNISYGNNFFYTAVDSTRKYFYPAGSFGKAQSTDIISTSTSNNNPLFVNLDPSNVSAATDNSDFHLQAGSPAKGKGNPTYNNDIGAYTSDGKGNMH